MLSDLDVRVLAFAKRHYRHAGARDEAIRVEFGLSPFRFTQLLLHVCDQPEALAAEPVLVNRVRRGRRRTA